MMEEKTNNDLWEKLDRIENGLKNEIGLVKTAVQEVQSSVDLAYQELEERCARLEDENKELWDRVDRLEGQSKRSNLMFYGVKEEKEETWGQTENKVRSLIETVAEVKLSEIDIERAHRVGRKGPRERPVVVKFLSYKKKQEVLRHGSKLKSGGISVAEHFTDRVRDVRSHLKRHLEKAKAQGHEANLRFDKLVVDNRVFRLGDKPESLILERTLTASSKTPAAGLENQAMDMEERVEGSVESENKRKRNVLASPVLKLTNTDKKIRTEDKREGARSKDRLTKAGGSRSGSPSVREYFKKGEEKA